MAGKMVRRGARAAPGPQSPRPLNSKDPVPLASQGSVTQMHEATCVYTGMHETQKENYF